MMWHESRKQLADLTNLQDDWDGQGAIAPSLSTIEKALALHRKLSGAGELPPAARICAGPMGEILILWLIGNTYLDAEITPTGEVVWMEQVGEQRYRHWTGMDYVPVTIKKGT